MNRETTDKRIVHAIETLHMYALLQKYSGVGLLQVCRSSVVNK